MNTDIGKALIFFGTVLILIGAIFLLTNKIHPALVHKGWVNWIGRLPGDIYIQKKNFTFFFPIATSILISVVLSIIFYLLGRK